jgi:transporter family-2 protein
MLYIIIAIVTGGLVTLSRLVNSNLSDEIGIFQSTFYNYLIGLIASFVVLIFSNDSILTFSTTLSQVPIWAFTGGLIGVLVVALSSYVTPKISVFYLTILTFIGQLFTGIIMDYYTLNILSIGKLIGGFFVLSGLIINVLIDKKDLIKKTNCSQC